MSDSVLLCIDAGTTRFKAAAITPQGSVLAEKHLSYGATDGGRHEYSHRDLLSAFSETLVEILKQVPAESITGIGITGHGPTLIPLDTGGNPLHPGIGYLDDRVKRYIQKLAERENDKITSTMYIPIALFFREEMPDIYEKTSSFLQPFDYLALLLTGSCVASSSSSGIKPWHSSKILDAGLDRDKFPPIRYMGQEIGKTTAEGAGRYGIPAGIPLHAVGVDFAAALVGSNMLEPGKSCERAGSSGGINLCWGKPVHDDRLLCYEHFVQNTWNVAGITSTYGKSIEWAEKNLCADGFHREKMHREQPGIIFLPYLKGERTPLWNPYAKGLFFGLEQKHDGIDLLIAVHTGISLAIRECIDIIESHDCAFQHPVVSTGGLSGEEWFMQLKADITGKTFSRMQLCDAELLGISIVLSTSLGHYKNLGAAASSILREEKRFTPHREKSAMYDRLFNQYCQIRKAVSPYF